MGIRIGRVVANGKIHMHIDGRGCGAKRRAHITKARQIRNEMLMWAKPTDLCRRCFSANRVEMAASLNANGSEASWSEHLDTFLGKVWSKPANGTSPERLEQIRRELAESFRERGVTVARAA